MAVTQKEGIALYQKLDEGVDVPLKVLKRSRSDYTKNNPVIFLLIKRQEKIILLPDDDFLIHKEDKMLIVCTDKSETDLAYIFNNYYELHYVLYGKEKHTGIFASFLKG